MYKIIKNTIRSSFRKATLMNAGANAIIGYGDKVKIHLSLLKDSNKPNKKSGIPTKIVLTKLGLGYVADNLSKLGFIRN